MADEIKRDAKMLSLAQAASTLKRADLCKKAGIIFDGEFHHLVMYKNENSKKPLSRIPLEHVIFLIDDYMFTHNLIDSL